MNELTISEQEILEVKELAVRLLNIIEKFDKQEFAKNSVKNQFVYTNVDDIYNVMKNYGRIYQNALARISDDRCSAAMKKMYKWQVEFVRMRNIYLSENLDYLVALENENKTIGGN